MYKIYQQKVKISVMSTLSSHFRYFKYCIALVTYHLVITDQPTAMNGSLNFLLLLLHVISNMKEEDFLP